MRLLQRHRREVARAEDRVATPDRGARPEAEEAPQPQPERQEPRLADPEPTVALAVAFRQRPPLAARRFVELAQELGRQPKPASRPRL